MKKKQKQKNQKEQKNKIESIKRKGSGYQITILAKPNAKQSKITQINDDYIGVSIGAPPKDGQANQQLLLYLGKLLGVKKTSIYLDKGAKSKDKKQLETLLQVLKQQI